MRRVFFQEQNVSVNSAATVDTAGAHAAIDRISHNDELLALILRANFKQEGIVFLTPSTYSQQLAYMQRPPGHVIDPHTHNPVAREVAFTREVLFIRSGRVRVDLYTDRREYVVSRILEAGDVILLASGGHGFEMLENTEMIEVKQGPYAGDNDKTRFEPTTPHQLRFA